MIKNQEKIDLGLSRIIKGLNYFNNPHKSLNVIHVAGTNGKGSISNMISSVLKSSGLKTGLFTSPSIKDIRERIKIDGVNIPAEKFSELSNLISQSNLELTYFEFLTLMAFIWFKKENCDIVVLEVGLGGRLDATNVIEKPLASVITSISFDHTDILGNTLEKIAKEKCGIIKKNSTVIVYPDQDQCVMEYIKNDCFEKNCRLIIPDISQLKDLCLFPDHSSFFYKGEKIEISLIGEHQIKNCLVAIECLKTLNIDDLCIKDGIKKLKIPGRFEIISKDPFIVLDVAHNISGITALANNIKSFFKNKKLIGVFGVLKDKNYKEMSQIIIPLFDMVFTATPNSERALDSATLAQEIKPLCENVIDAKTCKNAYMLAKKNLSEGDCMIVFGSFYLIGEIK